MKKVPVRRNGMSQGHARLDGHQCSMASTRVLSTSQRIWGAFLHGVCRPGEWLGIDSNGKNRNWTSRRGITW